ncbi:MAG: hypothetical protein IT383_14765 [Deltaproteobacteria bacterium]|nr:hypothetical protein [Deltaproteobacteria bacterium]
MAEQGFLQRGLTGMRNTVREVRTGEGKGTAAAVGKSAKKAIGKAKAGLEKVKRGLGFSGVDDFDGAAEDEQRRRKRARELIGDDEPTLVPKEAEPRRDLSTVAPEFRAQISAGLAAANSMTTGSTLVDGGKRGGGSGGDNW